MSGILRIAGTHEEIGKEIGYYWGNYFALLETGRKEGHTKLYDEYQHWLKDPREDLAPLQQMVEKQFPLVWDEIRGMLDGVNSSNIGFEASLGGLFSCCIAESDLDHAEYYECSSVVLRTEKDYVLVHSDEWIKACPLLAADIRVLSEGQEVSFFSLSHPFQLPGSAAGCNRYFAVQGNSIGCKDSITFKNGKKKIPKTVLSRKLLELESVKAVADLYRKYPCSLPNHHLFITPDGAYSLEVRPRREKNAVNKVSPVRPLPLAIGKTFCHTNHFKRDEKNGEVNGAWRYKDATESPRRLKALEEAVGGATSALALEGAFQTFLTTHCPTPDESPHERQLDLVSGYFSFVADSTSPYLRAATFCYGA